MFINRALRPTARRQPATRSGSMRSPPTQRMRSDGGKLSGSAAAPAASSCQKAVGGEATVIDHSRQRRKNSAVEPIISSVRSTRVAPRARQGKISSTLLSKLIDENCSTRSSGTSS